MKSNLSLGVAYRVASVVAGLSLLQCTQQPTVVAPNGSGGNSGQGGNAGATSSHHDAMAGGANGKDAISVVINLDVIPQSYWESDAPQAPDIPPAPSEDANCGITSSDTTRQRVDVLLVLDRSASMSYSIAEDCYCSAGAATAGSVCSNTANCTTRWDAIKPALTTTLSTTQFVDWGLKFFPSKNSTANCTENTAMDVAVATGSETKIESEVTNANFNLSTPTAAAINAATAYLKTLTDPNKKFILVATDGEPNCGPTSSTNPAPSINTDDVAGAVKAATDASAAGFPVYVVGIGPNLGNLTQIAQAGGTTDFYPVASPQQLTDALSSISKVVGSCSFHAAAAPQDPNNVAVYVNKQLVARDANDGWEYGATNQDIELHGSYCDHITAGDDTTVQILFGCRGAPPFPPFVP
jgi:hypothetical protein